MGLWIISSDGFDAEKTGHSSSGKTADQAASRCRTTLIFDTRWACVGATRSVDLSSWMHSAQSRRWDRSLFMRLRSRQPTLKTSRYQPQR